MDPLIMTISREFGSGGRVIGQKLSERLGIPCYDRIIIEKAAEKSGLSAKFIEEAEIRSASFIKDLFDGMYILSYDIPIRDKAYNAQAEVIREMAESGSCIIVGRCADHILKDYPNLLRLFIHGDLDARMAYAIEHYGLEQADARSRIAAIDRGRANHYKAYTREPWGLAKNYDLGINTTKFGIDGAVDHILAMVDCPDRRG